MPDYLTFDAMLHAQNQQNIAIYCDKADEKVGISYQELNRMIALVPPRREKTIGILCENNLETILSIFSFAPTHNLVMLNPNDDTELLKKQIRQADANYLVGDPDILEDLQDAVTEKESDVDHRILFFTSGTTDSGKPVILSEASLCAAGENGSKCLRLSEDDILYSILPYSHVFGFVCSLLWALDCGASVALSRGRAHLMDDLAYYRPTVISLVPQIAAFYLKYKVLNSQLRLVLIGAGDCSEEILQGYFRLGIRVSCGYGLTETSSGVALSLGDDPYAMTICPYSRLKIAEDKEILIGGKDILMEGYYHDKEATASVMADGWFHTGDLGEIDSQGKLHLIGRKKDILVLNDGTKIYLPEYEARLMAVLPGSDLAVSMVDDVVTLFLYTKADPLEVERRIAKFNEHYPRGSQVGDIIYRKEPIPRTQTGKVRRHLLKEEQSTQRRKPL